MEAGLSTDTHSMAGVIDEVVASRSSDSMETLVG